MPDIEAPFELAKLQWRFSRSPAGGVSEDVAVMTFHFVKATSPTAPWAEADPATIEDDLGTLWATLAGHFGEELVSDQYRWYRDGPAYYELVTAEDPYHYQPIGNNPAFRVTEVDMPGTATDSMLPPQLAISVTEKVSRRGSWGRVYLPNPTVTSTDADGRVGVGTGTAIAAAFGTFYGTMKAAGTPVVVFSIQKPERPKKNGQMLGAEPARALEVTQLVVDNVFDVVRSRRWEVPTQRFTATP